VRPPRIQRRAIVGISTLVDRSTRHLRQEQPTEKEACDSEPLLHLVPPTLQRPHNPYPQSQTLWLVGSMLAVPLEAVDHGREFGGSLFLQTFAKSSSFPNALRSVMGLGFYISGARKKQSDYQN
jgi:hypothetical protein